MLDTYVDFAIGGEILPGSTQTYAMVVLEASCLPIMLSEAAVVMELETQVLARQKNVASSSVERVHWLCLVSTDVTLSRLMYDVTLTDPIH